MNAIISGKGQTWLRLFAYAGILIGLSFLTITMKIRGNTCVDDSGSAAQCRFDALGYDTFSARLLVNSVMHDATEGDHDVGGFMTSTQKSVHIATVEIIDGRKGARKNYPYVSNFGLQYFLAKHMPFGNLAQMSLVHSAFSLLCGLAMAIVAAGIALFADHRFGRLSGIGVILIFGLSPPMILHALNPYWMIFLCFLPFLAMLSLYPQAQTTRQFTLVAAITGALVALKALTGYEYISTIALGAALPIIFYELEANGRVDRAVLRKIVARSLIVGLFAVLGFVVAAGLHVAKAVLLFGTLQKGLLALTLPMSYSSYDNATGVRGDVVVDAGRMISAVNQTFLQRNMNVNLPLYGALVGSWMLMLKRHSGSPGRLWNSLDPAYRALVWTWLAALPISISWIFLAARHSVVHPHINWVLGYLFAHVFAAMLVGRNWAILRKSPAEIEVRNGGSAIAGA